MMPICTGSDGGGSIRIPSAYSGLFGFKTSFGRVGYAGNFDSALTSVPGPMCRSVRDAARYVDAIAGPTNSDPMSLPRPVRSYEDAIHSGDAVAQLRGKRAAWSSTLGFAVCDPEVEKLSYEAALALCAAAGAHVGAHEVESRGRGAQTWDPVAARPARGAPLEACRVEAVFREINR
jgi:Asp-tRNA(Asn)/Glu-tRNA(Gln) amidotransferase A subunit family amidase